MFKRVDHIGVIVRDLADGERWLHEVFGLSAQRRLDLPNGRAVFYDCGNVQIELIALGDPEERRARLGDGARARIEHIAVEVDDVRAALKTLSALGVRITTPEPVQRANAVSAWTVAETTGGVSYQLMQKLPASGGGGAGGRP
jgi:methylmalonyl-CoA/ethylmalonyl-CoA epimerase